MTKSVRNAIGLVACLLVISAAGGFLVSALHSTSQSPTHLGSAAMRVLSDDAGGTAKLSMVTDGHFGSSLVPAGTQLELASSTLAGFAAPGPPPAAGAVLSCDLRVSQTGGSQVIDVLRCGPAPAAKPARAAAQG